MRRANAKPRGRQGDLTRHQDDETSLERLTNERERISNSSESLLGKFNRLARDTAQADGHAGEICGFDGRDIIVRTPDGGEQRTQIRRVLKKMLSGVKSPLAVGDSIRFTIGHEGDAVIVAINERSNQLARADSHNKALLHVFAANIDRLVIVSALAMPEIKTGLIDRYLLIAHYNNITPLIILNKCDLGDPGDVRDLYRGLGYEVFTTTATTDPVSTLRQALAGCRCVFAGQSGVGKSSLVNALYPQLQARVGAVSDVQRKGRHTTTAARSYAFDDGTCLVDTPGIRECGITGLEPLDVALLYPDIARLHPDCRFHNCSHRHEPDCAVLAALDHGSLDLRRYLSYRSIIDEDLAQT
ncbi:MAG: ribosome small subunit-dependent GTPase A [Planctomycetota bacterium]